MLSKEIFYSQKEEPNIKSDDFLLINILKGIGIILVVMGHLKEFKETFDVFRIYFYHMPLFFFIGGYLLKDKYSIVNYIIKAFKNNIVYLVILYIFFGLINDFILFDNLKNVKETVFLNHSITEIFTNPFNRNFHNNSFFLIAWFLLAYTGATIATRGIISITKTIIGGYNRIIYAIIGILIGYLAIKYLSEIYKEGKLQSINYLTQVIVGSMYMLIGYASKNLIRKINIYWFIAAFSILYTIKEKGGGSFVMSWSNYGIGNIEALLVSFSGIAAIIYISNIVTQGEHGKKILNYIGSYSKDIMSFHLIVFLLIDFIFFLLGLYDINKSAPFIHNENYYTWFLYIIGGIYIPILIAIIYKQSTTKLKSI